MTQSKEEASNEKLEQIEQENKKSEQTKQTNKQETIRNQAMALKKISQERASNDTQSLDSASAHSITIQPKPTATNSNKKQWNQEIVKAYINFCASSDSDFKLNDEEKQKLSNGSTDGLAFTSTEQAGNFFEQLVKERPDTEFFAAAFDGETNKPMDYNLLSCGTGELFKGTLQDIEKSLTNKLTDQTLSTDHKSKLEKGLARVQSAIKQNNPSPNAQDTANNSKLFKDRHASQTLTQKDDGKQKEEDNNQELSATSSIKPN